MSTLARLDALEWLMLAAGAALCLAGLATLILARLALARPDRPVPRPLRLLSPASRFVVALAAIIAGYHLVLDVLGVPGPQAPLQIALPLAAVAIATSLIADRITGDARPDRESAP